MSSLHDQLESAIFDDNLEEVSRLLREGIDLNVRCYDGAPVLHNAVLHGNVAIIWSLLEHGADPNLAADEPTATILTEKPLDLAMQCRFLMDFEKYDPVVKLLEEYGATGCIAS